MTEPVRTHWLTDHSFARRSCAGLVALSFALVVPSSVRAAPAAEPSAQAPAETEADSSGEDSAPEEASPVDMPEVATIEAALADGDLSTAKELAVERRQAQPIAENYELEAAVYEALGDYGQAKQAHRAALEDLPEDAEQREQIEARLEQLEADSRGTQADEPESTHREAIDAERAKRLAALAPKPPPPPVVIDTPAREPVIEKWYFWVTLGAIVASAGAIVGIAASTAVDENKSNNASASGARRPLIPVGGAVFRF